MKKMNWLYLIIVIAFLANCNGKEVKEESKPDTTITPLAVIKSSKYDSVKTVISLAQLFVDTTINNPKLLMVKGAISLKKLWAFDEQLYILSSDSTKKFIVTKNINPCCPCSTIDPMCCQCLIDTDFAAVSAMEAEASLDGTSMEVLPAPIAGVDLFSIPAGTADGEHKLKISGKSIPTITYTVDIRDGRMELK